MMMLAAVLMAMLLGATLFLFLMNLVIALKENVAVAIFIVFLAGMCFYLAERI